MLDKSIEELGSGTVPSLLLHSCCAPCSSYVLEYLSEYFKITVFYYNPNICPQKEYNKRVLEQKNFIERLDAKNPVGFCEGRYDTESFYSMAAGREAEKEGGARCMLCYELRLREAARMARDGGFDWFTTTLTVSPYKNAQALNEIGERLGREYGVPFLNSDFKKRNGYKRSIELSAIYGLYRQDYCGCEYSLRQRQEYEAAKLNIKVQI